MKHGKRYSESTEKIDKEKKYHLKDALSLLKDIPHPNFDETVELHFRLGVDPKQANQIVRGTTVLPHGTGKKLTVLVFAEGDKAEEAKEAGADYVGTDELADKIKDGWTDFDVAIATPNMMRHVGKLGRILGPRGLMPNPKAGTVTMDVKQAVEDAKAGKVEYRVDKFGNIHVPVGKMSFDNAKLAGNIIAIFSAILKERPAAAKGKYIRNMTLTSSMSPGIKLDSDALRKELK
ncbi:MAG: 50S ribosomal protein L1 [Candidatus Cloacimonetes bacterium]|nr:50S ribosomal protein L1 [Candidatus Cloacimonadota bacterium]MBS3766905.1 50S ribosomal protein L1 [Candidatus Cloacimonadota bacterium]